MKSAEYWRERFKILEETANNRTNQSVDDLMKVFQETERSVLSDIESWYARFANNNQISVAEARKFLTTGQMEKFRWTVDKYIKVGQQQGLTDEWMRKLENASARFHVSRLEAIQLQIQQQMELLYGNQLDSIDNLLSKIISNGYTQGMFEVQKGIGIGWNFTALDQKKIDLLLSKPWTSDGRTFRDRCWMHKTDLLSGIQSDMLQGMLRGDGLQKTSARIAKRFGVSKSKAANLVHTESTYFNGIANKQLYKEIDVESVEIIETLDGSTCEICGSLDGKIVPMSEYQPGVTVPPFHPRCRGTTAPAIDPDIIGERIARDEDGNTYYVPSNMTHEQWAKIFAAGSAGDSVKTAIVAAGFQKSVAKKDETGIIVSEEKNGAGDVHCIGKIDRDIYSCITSDIVTDEVIITDERIQHIKDRHPGDYERYISYISQILAEPDYILEANKPNTAFVLKKIDAVGEGFEVILRLQTSGDVEGHKNSVITFLKVQDKRYNRYLRTKKILYKKE